MSKVLGEKKRNEILQLLLLDPKICLLDEIDSGLDVDAIQTIGEVIKKLQEKKRGFFVISHYARLFEIIKPSRAIVIINGRVVLDTDSRIISRIDKEGYEFIKTEYGVSIDKEEKSYNQISLGTCAINEKSKDNNGK